MGRSRSRSRHSRAATRSKPNGATRGEPLNCRLKALFYPPMATPMEENRIEPKQLDSTQLQAEQAAQMSLISICLNKLAYLSRSVLLCSVGQLASDEPAPTRAAQQESSSSLFFSLLFSNRLQFQLQIQIQRMFQFPLRSFKHNGVENVLEAQTGPLSLTLSD